MSQAMAPKLSWGVDPLEKSLVSWDFAHGLITFLRDSQAHEPFGEYSRSKYELYLYTTRACRGALMAQQSSCEYTAENVGSYSTPYEFCSHALLRQKRCRAFTSQTSPMSRRTSTIPTARNLDCRRFNSV